MSAKSIDQFLTPTIESLDQDDYVIATYLMGASKEADMLTRAATVGLEQTTGSWTRVPGETDEVRKRSAGRVVGVYSVPDYESRGSIPADVSLRWYVVRIAYPWVNFYDNLPLLMSTVIGNISAMDNLKLIDLDFPPSYLAQFKGPRFGVEGVRNFLNVAERPLLNNMIKPCTGISPEEGAKLFYGAAVGGTDWIKDDELLGGSPSFSGLEERIKAYMAAGERADHEKGETTFYSVNITDNQDRIMDNALRAIDAGVNALMINIFWAGFSAVKQLSEDPRISVPLMIHNCGSGAMVANPYGGFSSVVGAKLSRLAGADVFLDYVPTMKFGGIEEKFRRIAQVCQSPMRNIKPTMVHVGGGVTPGIVPYLVDTLGKDIAIGAGAGIHSHPNGPAAGAKALRAAIDAKMQEISLEKAAESSPELKVALDSFGIYGSEKMKSLFALS